MPDDEGMALYRAGLTGSSVGPLLEIGSYCGKSAVYLGAAAREGGTVLFTLDHHRGSAENQEGWEHHDARLVDARIRGGRRSHDRRGSGRFHDLRLRRRARGGQEHAKDRPKPWCFNHLNEHIANRHGRQ